MSKHLPFDRAERVAEEIRRIVAVACLADLMDPRLKGVSITRVKVTRDLRIARLFFHLAHGGDASQRNAAEDALKKATGYLKRELGRELSLKFLPTLEVFYDEAVDRLARIEELLTESKTHGPEE